MIKNMELAQVRRGESFILDGVKFVKLDEDAHASFVLTADVLPKHIPFEHKDAERKDHDNFVGSYLQKHVDIWLHQGHPNISKAVVERPINLLSMCGETVYGTPCVFGRVLTLDEYRRYRKYIPLASDWYWLATSYSPSSSYSHYAYGVYTDGSVNHGYDVVYYGYYCARPALYLESSILVSVEVETNDIEKMQDKVTALQRETFAEQKAMNMEIQRQLVEYDRKNELELDAIILWELHTQLGLGPKRLKKFFDGFSDALNALVNRYEMDISDDFWLCTHKLKEIGVDVEDWYRQKE